jgi:hypothetical protein
VYIISAVKGTGHELISLYTNAAALFFIIDQGGRSYCTWRTISPLSRQKDVMNEFIKVE